MIRKIILKLIVFVLVAGTSAFLINKINNRGIEDVSRELEEANLPTVYCEYKDIVINQMHGYTQTMATGLMRENVIPMNEEYGVDILVDDDSSYGVLCSYELRTIQGDSLIEEGELLEYTEEEGYLKYPVRFRMDVHENREYVLVFIIENEIGEKARYYTRVVNLSEEYANLAIEYSKNFHNASFAKNLGESERDDHIVYSSLKTTGAGIDYNLSYVNLTSSYDMVSWGALAPMLVTSKIPTIKEIDNSHTVIHYSFVVVSTNEGVDRYYNVDEYYNVQYNKFSEELELLSFDRYMEALFDESYINAVANNISLGITAEGNYEYVTSNDSNKITFEKEGELWYYDYKNLKLKRVFSFLQGNYSDSRTTNGNIDININSMDDDGNIYFTVYGYMSRGKHEGKNGISFYYFAAEDSKLQEKMFIECDETYDVMKQEVGKFSYFDGTYFYYLLDEALCKIDIQTGEKEIIFEGISSQKYMVSSDRKVVAYPNNQKEEDVTSIIIKNFETGETFTKTGTDRDRFMVFGFIGNDLIYGISDKNDIIISSYGQAILPLYKILIMQQTGETIRDYVRDDIYIMDVRVEDDTIYLDRSTKLNNYFQEEKPDFITYKKDTDVMEITANYEYDNKAMNRLVLKYPPNMYLGSDTKLVITTNKESENYYEFKTKTSTREKVFYVFDAIGYAGEYASAGKAITEVSGYNTGLVVDDNGNTIYRNLESKTYNTVADNLNMRACNNVDESLMACAYMCIEYINEDIEYEQVMECETWEEAFEKYTFGVGIDISGIDLSTALYFLDREVPFVASVEENHFVIVFSYNSTHVRYYDPVLGEDVKVTRTSFEEKLSMQSNTIYTYTSQ